MAVLESYLRTFTRTLPRRAAGFLQLFALMRQGGTSLVLSALVIHIAAGLTFPLLVVGNGVIISAATQKDASLLLGLVLSGCALLGQQILFQVQAIVNERLRLRIDAYVSERLVDDIAAINDLRLLERTRVLDEVTQAKAALEAGKSTPGAACAGVLALLSRYTALIVTVVLMARTASIAVGLLALVIALLNRFGQTHALSVWSHTLPRFGPANRRVRYLHNLLLDPMRARDVRVLRLGGWLEKRHSDDTRRYLRPMWWTRRAIYGRSFVLYTIATVVGSAVVIATGVTTLVAQGSPRSGDVAIILQASVACVAFGTLFPEADINIRFGRRAWEAISRLEEQTDDVSPRSTPHAMLLADSFPAVTAEVSLERVSFSYEDDRPLLEDVSLHLPQGRSLALVGVNGAGKSTLVKLLTGFYPPSSGVVTVDGEELTADSRLRWQNQVSVLFQDYVRYELSLRQNLIMQAPNHIESEERMLDVLNQVGLAEVYERLPLGLETPMSNLLPNGTSLSGGEWQRLVLARAIYAASVGARILILDEPTSQLDARGEAEFFEKFFDLTGGVTTLVISHRFSSVRRADSIAVLSAGRIAEQGTHDQLVKQRGEYARLFEMQSSRYH